LAALFANCLVLSLSANCKLESKMAKHKSKTSNLRTFGNQLDLLRLLLLFDNFGMQI